METLFPRKKAGRPSNRPSMEVLAELYQTHTLEEIAEMYDVKVSTVKVWVWNCRRQEEIEKVETQGEG